MTLLTDKIYSFICKQNKTNELEKQEQQVSNSLEELRNNVSSFHSEYVSELVSGYFLIECDYIFLAKFINLVIELYQDDFRVSKDDKTVGLEEGVVNVDYIYENINDILRHLEEEDDSTLSILISSELNGLEQFFVWCLYQLIDYKSSSQLVRYYDIFKSLYVKSVLFFENENIVVTPVNFLTLKLYQEFTFFNESGKNKDKRSLRNKDYTLSTSSGSNTKKAHFECELSEKLDTKMKIYLKEPTIFDILVGYLTIKSGKRDRSYELFFSVCYNKSQNRFDFEFDHGS